MKYYPLLLALAAAGLNFSTLAAEPLSTHQPQAPGYYRMAMGDWQITAVSDGTVAVPFDKLLTNITPENLQARMAQANMPVNAETSINAFVINTGKQLILVDAGAGPLFGKEGGHLPDNLRAAGIDPAAIDTVLLTHIHADHSGGVQRDGKPVFVNATVRVDKRDVDFWLNPKHKSEVEEGQRHTFAESERSLRPVIDAGKLSTFHAPVQIIPGIEAIPAAGHTPGSVIYRVTHGGKTLMLWGDIIHAQPVQFPQPEVAIHFDVDRQKAVATREKVLAQVAQEGDWVAAAHIAFPGIGKVMKAERGYRWVPINYNAKGE
ncbi:MBL fold metallo-hydrolase [Kosakonia sp. H02]|nr:MBL fold metallo-hydrolase [Kosakonia sp. H02]